MNPNLLCLLIATMERVEVLQAMGSTPAPILSLWALGAAYWETDWSCGRGWVPRTFLHLAFSCSGAPPGAGPGRAYSQLQDTPVSITDGPSVMSEAEICMETVLALWGSLGTIYWLRWFTDICHLKRGAGTQLFTWHLSSSLLKTKSPHTFLCINLATNWISWTLLQKITVGHHQGSPLLTFIQVHCQPLQLSLKVSILVGKYLEGASEPHIACWLVDCFRG